MPAAGPLEDPQDYRLLVIIVASVGRTTVLHRLEISCGKMVTIICHGEQ